MQIKKIKDAHRAGVAFSLSAEDGEFVIREHVRETYRGHDLAIDGERERHGNLEWADSRLHILAGHYDNSEGRPV